MKVEFSRKIDESKETELSFFYPDRFILKHKAKS